MAKKVSLDTIQDLLNEVDKASIDKTRTIADINNKKTRLIVQECSDTVLKKEPGILTAAYGAGVIGAAVGAVGVGGAAAGIGGIAGGGIAAGLAGGGAAAHAMAVGAAAGAPVPIVGPLIGGAVGLVIGGIAGGVIGAKQKQKKERLYQEALKKQNDQIAALKAEVQKLQEKMNKNDEEIARLKYLIGVLFGYIDSLGALGAAAT